MGHNLPAALSAFNLVLVPVAYITVPGADSFSGRGLFPRQLQQCGTWQRGAHLVGRMLLHRMRGRHSGYWVARRYSCRQMPNTLLLQD